MDNYISLIEIAKLKERIRSLEGFKNHALGEFRLLKKRIKELEASTKV